MAGIPIKRLITTIYFRRADEKLQLEALAHKAGLSLSQYLIRTGLGGGVPGGQATLSAAADETREWKQRAGDAERRLLEQTQDLRGLTHEVVELLKATRSLQAHPVASTTRDLDAGVLRVLTSTRDSKGRHRAIAETEILDKLGIFADNTHRIEHAKQTLANLMRDGLVKQSAKGYQWTPA